MKSKAKNVSAGVAPQNKKKVGPVDAKGAYTKVQKRTLGKMKMGGKMKKAEDGTSFAKLAPPYDKATFADKIAGAKKNAGKAKSGAKMAKQAAVAIAMKKAGKTPKKAMSGYGGKAASMVPMKNGGKMKKAQTGDKLYPTSGVGKDVPAKNGKSMKKCKYGCK
jgi:hypothetical protein